MFFSTGIGFFLMSISNLLSNCKMREYTGLIIYLTITLLICGLLAGAAYVLSLSSIQDSEKKSEYECGFEPFDSATRLPFDVHFYLVGILFLIFDVEIALLFPWVLSLHTCGWFGFYLMISFIFLLSIGFLYEWKRGALIWPSRQIEPMYKTVIFLPIDQRSQVSCEAEDFFFITKNTASVFPTEVRNLLLPVLPEVFLLSVILYLIIKTALELDRNHVKKIIALEALCALQWCLLVLFILYEIELINEFHKHFFNGYAGTTPFTVSFKMLSTLTVFFILHNSEKYIANHKKELLEYPLILTLSFLFMLLLISAQHLVSAFICIVGFSLNLYVLILFDAPEAIAREAGIKYYYLSTFSSGLLIYGTFLILVTLKTGHFNIINQLLSYGPQEKNDLLLKAGIMLILVGTFFKLSAFPGHLWAAEVYEGSPNVITAYFMLPVKIAMLSFLIQLLTTAFEPVKTMWQPVLALTSISSMIWGCFSALFERKTKRFLAYASINQIGFLFIGISSASLEGYRATILYLFIYAVMNISFLTIFLNTTLSNHKSLTYLTDFRGLGLVSWLVGWALAVAVLSMAGIPPLAGFFGKYYLILHAQEQQLYLTVLTALVTSLVSAYYYLRIIKIIWFENYKNVKQIVCALELPHQLWLFTAEAIICSFIPFSCLFLIKADALTQTLFLVGS